MDTVTHIVVGAAAGELVLGKKLGRQAMIWGAGLSFLPDIDYFIGELFFSDVGQLTFHRGYTHSLVGALVAVPLFALILRRLNGSRGASAYEWGALAAVAFGSHILLDCLTTYGVQLFLPFSTRQVAVSGISIIDPLFTLPLLVATIASAFFRSPHRRRRWMGAAVAISTIYLGWALAAKSIASSSVRHSLERQEIPAGRYTTKPTLLNSFLWRAIAEVEDGYHVGFYSIFDGGRPVEFHFEPRNDTLLFPVEGHPKVRTLKWATQGYYSVSDGEGAVYFNDLRFGRASEWIDRTTPYVFTYRIEAEVLPDGSVEVDVTRDRRSFRREKDRPRLGDLFRRIAGR